MGSDMSMEHVVEERYARWEMDEDEQMLHVYSKSSYDHQEHSVWAGTAEEVETEVVQSLLKLLIDEIPKRPDPVPTLRTRIKNLLAEYMICDGHGEPYDDYDLDQLAEGIVFVIGDDA